MIEATVTPSQEAEFYSSLKPNFFKSGSILLSESLITFINSHKDSLSLNPFIQLLSLMNKLEIIDRLFLIINLKELLNTLGVNGRDEILFQIEQHFKSNLTPDNEKKLISHALKFNDQAMLGKLVNLKISLDQPLENGETPLERIIQEHEISKIQQLLLLGCKKVGDEGKKALVSGIRTDDQKSSAS